MSENLNRQRGKSSVLMMSLIVLLILTAIGTAAAYNYGEGHLIIDGRTVSEMQPWEVVGGVIAGIIGLIVALVLGVAGLIIGILAMMIALALAFAGVAVGLFISAGTVLGPFLLLAAIILLLRRNRQPVAASPVEQVDDHSVV